MSTWADTLADRTRELGALCVGIDPHPQLLTQWGLADDVAGLEACALGLVEALGDRVAVFKPQSAFFEAHGSAGVRVLEKLLAAIREAGALSLLDVKRGDIGSTMAGYARAYLSDSSPLRADAITVSPYLGVGALTPAVEMAADTGRGLYVLARTSNPDGAGVQQARTKDTSVAQLVVDQAQRINNDTGTALMGLVVGGTHDDIGVDLSSFTGSVLVPGIGAQGARIEDLPQRFGAAITRVLPTTSRAVIGAGPDPEALRAAAAANVTAMRKIIGPGS
ncbi:orotidine-5'-phosphate decarboxylase [Enemella sp. A6]|uniref:orotidine-5'-phosphate decarboxylase n=1 Tax=Enemella sp. A6 TaxID=3440152 RepID=UPI003EBEA9E4